MQLSTSLVLFAVIVAGTFQTATVFAIPYNSPGPSALYPSLSGNPNTLEIRAGTSGTVNNYVNGKVTPQDLQLLKLKNLDSPTKPGFKEWAAYVAQVEKTNGRVDPDALPTFMAIQRYLHTFDLKGHYKKTPFQPGTVPDGDVTRYLDDPSLS
ncbi:hypothetical protein BC835DRAFT_1319808 [Cytidiella melzeri]|nr:hypothetical protein BC835DRAFT_1319808 [Cytidiella melzeri]